MPSRNPELPWALDAPSLECCDCEPELPVRASMRPLLTALGRYWGLNSCASGASCAATRSRPPMDRKAAKTATVLGSMMGQLPGNNRRERIWPFFLFFFFFLEAIEKNGQSNGLNERIAKSSKVEQRGRLASRIIHRTGYNRYKTKVRYRCRRLCSNSIKVLCINRCDNSEEAVDLKDALRTISPRRCFPTLFFSTTHNMYNAALGVAVT